mgnify:FL=1
MKATPKFVTHTAKLNAGYPTDFHGIRIVFLNPDELTVVKQEKVTYYLSPTTSAAFVRIFTFCIC